VPGAGFQWWSEQVSPTSAWQAQQSVVGFAGLGGAGAEATDDLKISLTKESSRLYDVSRAAPLSQLNFIEPQIQSLLGILSGTRPFAEGRTPGAAVASGVVSFLTLGLAKPEIGSYWHSSQRIRSDLQAALLNVGKRRSGQAPLYRKSEDAKTTSDFFAGEVKTQAGVMYDTTKKAIESAGSTAGDILDSPKKTAAMVAGVALLSLGVYAYAKGKGSGPTVRIG
jgi:hypothetical protein